MYSAKMTGCNHDDTKNLTQNDFKNIILRLCICDYVAHHSNTSVYIHRRPTNLPHNA